MESQLYLETEVKQNKTYIKDVYFTSPYKIMSPFRTESHIDVMLMSASAGLLDGDTFQGEMVFGQNSDVTFLSQSYEKVFCTKGNGVVKKMSIQVDENAKVKYLPYPVIPFRGSDFQSETKVNLKKDAVFLYGDIFTCGRTGMGEYFKMKRYESKTQISVEGKLVFADHTLILPQSFQYRSLGKWSSYTHNGMLYIHMETKEQEQRLIETIRNKLQKKVFFGVSAYESGIVVRILSMSGEEIYRIFQEIADMVS